MPFRFPFLSYPLQPFSSFVEKLPKNSRSKLPQHLAEAKYSVRLLRYWWSGQALAAEAKKLGRPLHVVDLGCERGWLKHFTPEGVVERWTGLDWNPQPEVTQLAQYDEVKHANFDEHLPLPTATADAVVSLHVFEHLLRPGSTMSEISRLLKPGGIFLGGAPTMPHWIATLREKHFRRLLQQGKLAAGGHITVLSPQRWQSLVNDAGFDLDFITGSHAIRRTGSKLENSLWWVRLNQIWGALFPSLGSECYLMARRQATTFSESDRLTSDAAHHRALWITLAATTAIALMFGFSALTDRYQARQEQRIASWLSAHQSGSDQFLIWDEALAHWCGDRPDLHCADSIEELQQLIQKHQNAHLLVTVDRASTLTQSSSDNNWRIDSRLDFDGTDYLLLKKGESGTHLKEYLLGAN
ncbi:class I SAM-dependent methyltransferase [Phragmitibacter flavus]|uniref:Class I SAM-dependent methyltransferase n=1 Tax=Phragmitibacter flavus TaxID=2576071 RepID=A0A5R8KJG6_9BACT|nr:class I SAM-dependent methyltransferase [Phragmitibacter flavus]TLD72454.1 class I SAM-dependent methyltransferase [Phragmitibacter flavus]